MCNKNRKCADDINGSSLTSGTASGRGAVRDSQVVNLRNPYGGGLKIGTWNVRSMTKPEKIENIKMEMERYMISILAITETRWKENSDITTHGYRLIYSGGSQCQRGVGKTLNKQAAKNVKEVDTISDRLLIVRLAADPVDLNIIMVYMQTSAYGDQGIEDVYDQIEEEINNLPSKEYTVLLGDMNAVVGEGREGSLVGEHGLGKRNERGRMLIDFCSRNKLCIMNTWFKNPERRKCT